ncbi:MAG: phosphotyrosine protein phosphatase [Devosia nanyangense]|uniref:Phosphotyrosine protein phosphatase n=1 Tax=Devosia nanyangense TaxID=1228055 RepID=A0A933NWS6_9HYPH|nr:phosphotyrosine protein phosphatase [Devosia nanyangense]
MTNALFVCSRNRKRSPTAEVVFATWPDVETDSAGLDRGAEIPLSAEQLDWADLIFVMERKHRAKLTQMFRARLNGKRIICLDIPDEYEFMAPELVARLEAAAGRYLR